MRILYIHQYFVHPRMPGATRSYELARRLVERGHEVDLITSDWQSGLATTDIRRDAGRFSKSALDGIRIHAIPNPYSNQMTFRERIRSFIRFAIKAARYTRRLDYDVVYATSTPLTVAIPGILSARRAGVPMLFEVRDLWPDLPLAVGALRNPLAIAVARRLEKTAYRYAARIVALSPDMLDALTAKGVPPNKLVVIPNGCDLDLFSPTRAADPRVLDRYPHLDHHPLVVYTGSLGPINNVAYLARIAAEVQTLNRNIRFAVFGDGALAESIEQLAGELGILGQTWFMREPVPKQDVPSLLRAADLAVSIFADVPGMSANSANKFFDALSSGTPVAINYSGWQAGLLNGHDAGLVLPANDPGKAARLLADYLSDEAHLKAAGRNARRLAETEFDRDRQARLLAEIIEQVVASGEATLGCQRQ
jgi:glycosyltransferase involved in cell wall biosynthesis